MQPPNTIDRYKHTRATITDVCYSAYNVSRASPGSQYAKGEREREAPIGVLCLSTERPVGAGSEIAIGPGDRGKEKDAMRKRARVQQRGRSTVSIVASGTLLLQTT